MRVSVLGVAMLVAVAARPGISDVHAAERSPWYIGASMGRSVFSSPPSTPDTFASIRASGSIDDLDLRSSGVRAYGGFRVNPYFALEAGYTDFGDIRFVKSDRPCPTLPGFILLCPAVPLDRTSGRITADGWNLSARGIVPLGERFELSGRLGVLHSTATLRAVQGLLLAPPGLPAIVVERTDHRTSPVVGVGLSYRVTSEFSFILDWERVSKVGRSETTGEMSVKLLSVGVRYDF